MNNDKYALIMFESAEKALAAELLTSGTEFGKLDVRAFADIGAIETESAKTIISTMEGAVVKLDRDMKKNVLHKKALILLAKENGDPSYKALLDMYAKKQEIFDSLEKKYGQEARVNQGTLISKLVNKFRGNGTEAATEAAKKVLNYNN